MPGPRFPQRKLTPDPIPRGLPQVQKREPYVDGSRMGITVIREAEWRLRCWRLSLMMYRRLVLSAGIYDFKEAYDEVTIKGIKGIGA
jgi:hypothetical protein